MRNDPYTGEQIRFDRTLPHSGDPIEGPHLAEVLGDRWIAWGCAIAVVILIVTDWLS